MKKLILILSVLLGLLTLASAQVASVTVDANGNVLNGKIINFATGKLSINGVLVDTALAAKQPLDPTLTALAGVTTSANKLIYATGSDAFATTDFSTFGRSLVDDADANAARSTLGLGTSAVLDVPATGDATSGQVVKGSDTRLTNARTPTAHASTHASAGSDPVTLSESQITNLTTDLSNKQPLDPELTAVAGLTSAADRLPYFTGSGTAALATFTAAGRALIDDASASAQRTTLGIGTTDSPTFAGLTVVFPAPTTGVGMLISTDAGWWGSRGNSQTIPPSDNGTNATYAVSGNYSNALSEIDFVNTSNGGDGFRWMQKTGASTFSDVWWVHGNGNGSLLGNLTVNGLTASSFIETDGSKVLVSKTAAQMRSDLSLVIGTNVEAWDADLDTYAANTPTTVGLNLVKLANPSAITFPKINADNTVTAESAATHRTSIGGTTVGQNLFTLTNPSAVTFPKIAADNTVSARTAAQLKTDLALTVGTDVEAWDADLDTWATKTAPSGTVVGTTDTQTLTNKSIDATQLTGTINRSRLPAAIAARVYNNANITLTSGAVTPLTFNSERFDTDSIHSTSSNTGRLTATTAGVYTINAVVEFAANATGTREILIRHSSGTIIAMDFRTANSGGNPTRIAFSTIYQMAASDYVTVEAYQDSGGNLDIVAQASWSPEFSMVWNGP